MSSIRYRGFDIVPRPYQLAESGRWTVDFDIRRNGRARRFSLRETHATTVEAQTQCQLLGRRIIEGRIEGWSVQDLRAWNNPLAPVVQYVTGDSLSMLIVSVAAILGFGGLAILREVR